jgi:spore germination protein GerM
MKNKKLLFYIVIAILLLLILLALIFFLKPTNSNENSNNELIEYTPQQEFSDDEIRKTIISLYFKNIETNTLIAEAKCIDVKELYKEPYSYLINMLIAGPENEKLESAIPEGTKVNSCTLNGNTLYVDLSKEFIDNAPSGIDEESMVIYSIVNTLTELNEVSSVKFLINGEENKSFKDGKISFKDVFVKND